MSKSINIGLIQDKDTNFIVYDETDRTDGGDYIEIQYINSLDIIFTGPEIDSDKFKIYHFNSDGKGYLKPYASFEACDCTGYLQNKTLTLEVDEVEQTVECTDNITSAGDMVTFLTNNFTDLDIVFSNVGGTIVATTVQTGADTYIKVVSGELLDYLNWNIGVYRGNDFSWNDATVLQKDFNFEISVEDFGYDDEGEIPETYWNIQAITYYTTPYHTTPDYFIYSYTNEYIEFTYKQTEIYRAKIFEYISRNFTDFLNVEQRWQTSMELFMQKSIYFDGVFKAFLASIEIGDVERAYTLLGYIIEFKTANTIL